MLSSSVWLLPRWRGTVRGFAASKGSRVHAEEKGPAFEGPRVRGALHLKCLGHGPSTSADAPVEGAAPSAPHARSAWRPFGPLARTEPRPPNLSTKGLGAKPIRGFGGGTGFAQKVALSSSAPVPRLVSPVPFLQL